MASLIFDFDRSTHSDMTSRAWLFWFMVNVFSSIIFFLAYKLMIEKPTKSSDLDIQGAIGEGIDSLFITGGLAAKETATVTQPDPEKLSQYVLEKQLDPTFSTGFLR